MQIKDIVIIAGNIALAALLFTFTALGKLTWSECIAALGLLGMPSALHLGALAIAKPGPTDASCFIVAGLALFAGTFVGCATLQAEKAAAEASYLGEQLRCVDAEPKPAADAGADVVAAARARIDACRAKVREQWTVADAAVEGGK